MKRLLFWPLALLLAAFGAVAFTFPLLMLGSFDPGAHLLDDTRAAHGGGRATDVVVSRVQCTMQEFGSEGSQGRGVHSLEHDCEFELQVPSNEPPAVEPDWASMDFEERMAFDRAESARFSARLRELERGPGPNDPPRSLRRRMPHTAHGRPLPVLRQFTPDGVPPRYGLVFPDGGLGWRWFRWTWETALFWGFAVASFMAIPALRRKLT